MKGSIHNGESVILTRVTPLPRSETKSAGIDAGRLRSCILHYLIGPTEPSIPADLRLFGWLKRSAYCHIDAPVGELANPERIRLAGTLWYSEVRALDLAPLAYKMSFVLTPKLEAALLAAKLPVGEVMIRLIASAFVTLQEKFYPGDELGFLIAVRSDKKVPEARLLLFPHTATGRPLPFAGPTQVTLSDGSSIWVEFEEFIRRTVLELGLQFYHREVAPPGISRRVPYRAAQEMLLTKVAYELAKQELKNENPHALVSPEVIRIRTVICREKLILKKVSELRELLTKAYASELSLWEEQSKELAEKGVAASEVRRGKVYESLRRMAHDFSPEQEAEIQMRAGRRSIRPEAFKTNAISIGWQRIKCGHEGVSEESATGWWRQRMLQDDALGAIMREISEPLKFSGDRTSGASSHYKRLRNISSFRPLQLRLAQLNKLLEIRREEGSKSSEREATAKLFAAKQLQEMRIRLHLLNLDKLTASGRIAGKPPQFLSDYLELKQADKVIPVTLMREEMSRGDLRDARLTARDRAISNSSPATDLNYKLTKVDPPSSASNPELAAATAPPELLNSGLSPVRKVSAKTPPRQILSEDVNVLDQALSQHGEAIQKMLAIPRHEMFVRSVAFPHLDATDPKSFGGLVI